MTGDVGVSVLRGVIIVAVVAVAAAVVVAL